jgi:hypothetical protein
MSPEVTKFTDKLIADLRENPMVQVWQAAQAVLLGAIQLKMNAEETKEVLHAVRMEFGMERSKFSEMMLALIRKMPAEFKRGDLSAIPMHWET